MIEIQIMDNGKTTYFPENLGECDARQFTAVSRFIYLFQNEQITEPDFLSLCVYALLDIQPSKNLDEKTKTDLFDNIAFLSHYITHFFEFDQKEKKQKFKFGFTHNPIPEFTHNYIKFKGPSNEFRNVKFGQYVKGLEYFLDYEAFGEKQTLVDMLNVFYKNKNPLIPKKLKSLKDVDLGILYGFYLYFASFHNYISTGTVFYNGVELDLSIIFSASESEKQFKSQIPGLGVKSILFEVAASGVFGTKTEVEETDFWEVLLRLYDMRKQSKDEKEYYERIQKKTK